jgi:hypothetical protein
MEQDASRNLEMNRRDAIKRVSLLFGGLVFANQIGLLSAVERAHARAATLRQTPLFTAQDIALLDEVADTMLPDTSTPGAKAAHVGPFMALMVTDSYSDADQAVFRDGVRQLNAANFMQASPADRLALVQKLDQEQKTYMDTKAHDAPAHYFRLMKELAMFGYFTSEIGCTQAQRYREVPGHYDPCVPYTPGETSWAAHA